MLFWLVEPQQVHLQGFSQVTKRFGDTRGILNGWGRGVQLHGNRVIRRIIRDRFEKYASEFIGRSVK